MDPIQSDQADIKEIVLMSWTLREFHQKLPQNHLSNLYEAAHRIFATLLYFKAEACQQWLCTTKTERAEITSLNSS